MINKEKLQEILNGLDFNELAFTLLEVADSYDFTGTAYIFLNVDIGEIGTGWVEQGSFFHEPNTIILIDEPTPFRWEDVMDEDIIDPYSEEWEEFENWKEDQDWDIDVFTFLEEKYGNEGVVERKKLIYESFVENMERRDDIEEQINRIYGEQ